VARIAGRALGAWIVSLTHAVSKRELVNDLARSEEKSAAVGGVLEAKGGDYSRARSSCGPRRGSADGRPVVTPLVVY